MTSLLTKFGFQMIFVFIQIIVVVGAVFPEMSIAADTAPISIGNIQMSSNAPVSPKEIQAEVDKINRELSKCNHYLGEFSQKIASEFGINTSSMVMYFDNSYSKDKVNSYKKLILFFFGPNMIHVDEYYPIRDKKYVVRYLLKTPIKQNQLNFETFTADYRKMEKVVLSKYIFINNILVMQIAKNGEIKEMLDLLSGTESEEGKLLQHHEIIALDDVSMD